MATPHRAREILASSYAGIYWEVLNEDGKDAYRHGADEVLAYLGGAGLAVIDTHDEATAQRVADAIHDLWYGGQQATEAYSEALARAVLNALAKGNNDAG